MSYHCGTCGALEADASNPESHSDWCPVRRAEKAEARVVELEEAIQDFSAIQDDFLDLHERNGVKVPDDWYEAYKTMRLAARGSPSVCSASGVEQTSKAEAGGRDEKLVSTDEGREESARHADGGLSASPSTPPNVTQVAGASPAGSFGSRERGESSGGVGLTDHVSELEVRRCGLCPKPARSIASSFCSEECFSRYQRVEPTDRPSDACATCGSPDPKRHPAVQCEGEVSICEDAFHQSKWPCFFCRSPRAHYVVKIGSGVIGSTVPACIDCERRGGPPPLRPNEPKPAEPRELHCEDCDRDYPVWYAPSDLWNEHVRHPENALGRVEPFLCPTCFAMRAERRGMKLTAWVLRPETEADYPKPTDRPDKAESEEERLRGVLEAAMRWCLHDFKQGTGEHVNECAEHTPDKMRQCGYRSYEHPRHQMLGRFIGRALELRSETARGEGNAKFACRHCGVAYTGMPLEHCESHSFHAWEPVPQEK